MGLSKFQRRLFFALPTTLILSSCGGAGFSPGVSTSIESPGSTSYASTKTLDDIEILDLSSGDATVSADDPASDYILIVNSTQQTGSNSTVRLASGGAAALQIASAEAGASALVTNLDPGLSASEQFHEYLRAVENIVSESGEFEETTPSPLAALNLGEEPALGDEEVFNVLSTMNSLTTYQEVTGELRYASDDLYVYVDGGNRANISDADIERLAHNFEDIALPRERELFGRESDINVDGHITILMTCTVNRMAASGGLVTGFFFPGDLYQRSSVNPASNAQEIFYTLVPDPSGKCGAPVTADFAVENILPGVLAHEYQHMNSFQQHVFRNKGSTEEPWLNECLSHLSEDLTGFGHENPSRVKLFLSQPSQSAIISYGAPTLPERGACYTFLRYLYEQSPDGDAFISNLYSSPLTGVANLEAAYNSGDSDFDEFPEFVSRWSLALSLSETGATSDPRYNFEGRTVDDQTGNLTGLCVRCDAQDGRGTVLEGPVTTTVVTYPATNILKGTATQFYRLANPAEAITVSGSGSAMTGALIRLK